MQFKYLVVLLIIINSAGLILAINSDTVDGGGGSDSAGVDAVGIEIDHHINVNQRLLAAAENGAEKELNMAIAAGADIDFIDADGFTALLVVALPAEFNLNALLILLRAGADPNIADPDGNTPLTLMVEHLHDEFVSPVLDNDIIDNLWQAIGRLIMSGSRVSVGLLNHNHPDIRNGINAIVREIERRQDLIRGSIGAG